jgi:hypothetical protein
MPYLSTRGMPPYRGLLAVDAERFSRNPSSRLPDLSAMIEEVLRSALERAELDELWEQRRFPQATGDGYVFGTFPEALPYLCHPLLDSLQEVLAEKDDSLRTIDRSMRLRLRVSVNVGPVPDSGDGLRDRIGTPTNATFRLLDCTALRHALERSNPDLTLVAAIVSQRVFDDVIRAGYTPSLHPDQFEQVTAEVPGKDFAEPAWIYVPRPSRTAARQTEDSPGSPPSTPRPPAASTYQNTGSGQQVNADTIHGGVSYGGPSS